MYLLYSLNSSYFSTCSNVGNFSLPILSNFIPCLQKYYILYYFVVTNSSFALTSVCLFILYCIFPHIFHSYVVVHSSDFPPTQLCFFKIYSTVDSVFRSLLIFVFLNRPPIYVDTLFRELVFYSLFPLTIPNTHT